MAAGPDYKFHGLAYATVDVVFDCFNTPVVIDVNDNPSGLSERKCRNRTSAAEALGVTLSSLRSKVLIILPELFVVSANQCCLPFFSIDERDLHPQFATSRTLVDVIVVAKSAARAGAVVYICDFRFLKNGIDDAEFPPTTTIIFRRCHDHYPCLSRYRQFNDQRFRTLCLDKLQTRAVLSCSSSIAMPTLICKGPGTTGPLTSFAVRKPIFGFSSIDISIHSAGENLNLSVGELAEEWIPSIIECEGAEHCFDISILVLNGVAESARLRRALVPVTQHAPDPDETASWLTTLGPSIDFILGNGHDYGDYNSICIEAARAAEQAVSCLEAYQADVLFEHNFAEAIALLADTESLRYSLLM